MIAYKAFVPATLLHMYMIRAGLSIVLIVPWEGAPVGRGAPISCQIFNTLF